MGGGHQDTTEALLLIALCSRKGKTASRYQCRLILRRNSLGPTVVFLSLHNSTLARAADLLPSQ